MADIRIKDLSSASSSASDDFIAVDGTTNGTRKLNAFSPTFGGNVVVTGTLTAGSGSHVFGNSANTAEIKAQRLTTDPSSVALQAVASHAIINFTGDTGYTWGRIGSAGNEILRIYHAGLTSITAVAGGGLAVGGGLNVSATTASTTTSTGALVVGNGTSGGLGVGGAIFAGGAINSDSNVIAARATIGRGDVGSPGAIGLVSLLDVSGGIGRLQVYNFTTSTVGALNIQSSGGALGIGSTSTVTTINGTTASTSTSSGALVVSGGVGVAGAVNVGGSLGVTGTITVSGDQNSFFSGSWPRMNFTTNGSSIWLSGATTGAATIQHDFQNRSTTSLLALYGTGNAVFAGNIKTAAPAGGTAAEWKLGTVATVSPTSPNRTIEVDIGGTIYYIHAKTTNN